MTTINSISIQGVEAKKEGKLTLGLKKVFAVMIVAALALGVSACEENQKTK